MTLADLFRGDVLIVKLGNALQHSEQERANLRAVLTCREQQFMDLWAERDALTAQLQQAAQDKERIKELARKEHELLASIVARLKEIGQIDDSPNANITGAIHGVIDGYVNWRATAKAAEAHVAALTAQIQALRLALEDIASAEPLTDRRAFYSDAAEIIEIDEDGKVSRPRTATELRALAKTALLAATPA